ncbi:MAG: hypothetical protein KFF73_13070 [Cyclobacteriaceae bacterium]|nr:hypothetical protein [Cyclobacteriaceae bacterium]
MIFAGIFIFLILVYLLYTRTGTGGLGKIFFPALLFKLLCGIGVGVIYFEHYRAGDTITFDRAANLVVQNIGPAIRHWPAFLLFSDLSFIDSDLPHVLQESRSLFFVKMLSIVYLFTGQSYWLSSLFFSLVSFTGGWFLVRTISRIRPDLKSGAIVAFLFFPPVMFWSSGILKDSVAFACLAGLAGILIRVNHLKEFRWQWIGGGIVLFMVLWAIKYHYAAVLLLSVTAVGLYRLIFYRFRVKPGSVWFLCSMILIILLFSTFHPNFRLGSVIEVMAANQAAIIGASRAGSHVEFLPLGTGWIHFLVNLPVSLFAGMYMPLPWQGAGILPKIAGIFNLMVLLFTLFRVFKDGIKLKDRDAWQWILAVYLLILAITIAYSSPNFGTLERYKTGYLPFFLLWVFSDERLLKFIKSKFW